MKKLLTLVALAFATVAHAGPGEHGPNGEHLDAPTVAAPNALARMPDGSVNVPVLAQRRLAVRTSLSKETSAAATVELPGRVVMDPNAAGRVQTLAGGKVQPGPKGLPTAGQAVRKGDVLAYVAFNANPIDAANQQAQLAQIRANKLLAQQRVRRLESLEGTVPRKDIEAARAEAQSLGAQESAVAASVGAREALVAPVTGVVASSSVVAGQVVDPKDILFEIVDPARVLIEASTADASLGARVGQAAISGLPDVKLQFLGAARSLREGTLPLTFRASGTGALALAIEQPVTVIATLNQPAKGYVLPAQAVTRSSSNESVVWVKASAERFIPRPIQMRPLDAKTVLVTSGLEADSRVVVQGASLLAQIR